MPETMEEAKPFEPTVLKFVTPEGQRQEQVARTPEEFEAMQGAGWKTSWGEWDIETAPATNVTIINAPQLHAAVSADTYQEVLRLIVAYEQEIRALTGRVEALEGQVAALTEAGASTSRRGRSE